MALEQDTSNRSENLYLYVEKEASTLNIARNRELC